MSQKKYDGKSPQTLRSRAWFDNPDNPDMTALYLERYLNFGLTREELQSGLLGLSNQARLLRVWGVLPSYFFSSAIFENVLSKKFQPANKVMPPSTRSTWPSTKPAASLARNATASAISCGLA